MSIELVSAFIMINDEVGQSLFSIEVKENKVEIPNASGSFNSFNDTKKALEEAIKTLGLLERFENEKV
jgi:hypothetical protein